MQFMLPTLTSILPDAWQPGFLQNAWVEAGFTLILWIALSRLLQLLAEGIIRRLTRRTKTVLDDKLLAALDKPVFFILILLGFLQAGEILGFPRWYDALILTLITIFAGIGALRSVNIILNELVFNRVATQLVGPEQAVLPLINKFISAFGWIMLGLFILTLWGVQIGPFLAGLGVAGLAVSFALQKSLEDIFAGISLTLDRNFKIGDVIKLPDGTAGKILDIGLRSTKLLNWDNEMVIIPNSSLAQATFINFEQPTGLVRGTVNFGVAYGSDPDRVEALVLDVARKDEAVLDDPAPSVVFLNMGDFSLDFQLRFYVKTPGERFDTAVRLRKAIYKRFQEEGIDIPFPTHTVYVKRDGENE